MSYFLSSQNLILNKTVSVTGQEARHILLSRRMKVGDEFLLQDPLSQRYVVRVIEIKNNSVTVLPISAEQVPSSLDVVVTLIQSVVSEKALEFVFQKSTELGVSEIVLFNSHNTATKLPVERFDQKLERWQKILWEAAKQSDRPNIPELKFIPSLSHIIKTFSQFEAVIICEKKGEQFPKLNAVKNVALVVGPEGGFTPLEVEHMRVGVHTYFLKLSPFVLRAETAAIACVAVCQNYFIK